MLIPLLYYHRGATRGCCTPYNENIRGCCTKRVPGGAAPLTEGVSGGAAPLTKRVPGGAAVQHCCTPYLTLLPPGKPPSPGRGCTIPGTSSIEVAAPPGIPLRGVRLCKTTDVLEFSSTLMEQRTLDARGVIGK